MAGSDREPGLSISDETIAEAEHVGREWPDGIHACAELQKLEPGRRPCTCGRCVPPTAGLSDRIGRALDAKLRRDSRLRPDDVLMESEGDPSLPSPDSLSAGTDPHAPKGPQKFPEVSIAERAGALVADYDEGLAWKADWPRRAAELLREVSRG